MVGEAQRSQTADWPLQTWLRIPSGAKPQIYRQIFAMAEIGSLKYWLEILFAAGIATFGLVQNSPAVIIGAMLISPLMGPIMATGLALAVGDVFLGIKAVLNLAVSIAAAVAISWFLVWLLPFHTVTGEILARTKPNLLDLGIALLSGLAGSVAVCLGAGGGTTALPGVAIAVALMPPLCTMGFGMGSPGELGIVGGAGLLFVTNLVAIVSSAFLVFFLIGMSSKDLEHVMMSARRDEQLLRFLSHGPATKMFASAGALRWRVLMVLILLAAVSVPLRRAFQQVATEAVARTAVQDELRKLVPGDALVSQQVLLPNDEVVVRLLSTVPIAPAKLEQAKTNLLRRTGRHVELTVDTVASKSDLAQLMERLAHTAASVPVAPAPPKPRSLLEMQQEILDRVRPAMEEIWPSSDAPIEDLAVQLGGAAPLIQVRYQSARVLDAVLMKMVLQNLKTKLGVADLQLRAERTRVPKRIASR